MTPSAGLVIAPLGRRHDRAGLSGGVEALDHYLRTRAGQDHRWPRHPVPAALIGRLAVSSEVQGQGIGRLLLADAVKRSLAVSEEIAIHALVVEAKDEGASQ